MGLNAIEEYLKGKGGYASIRVLKNVLKLNKKQVKRLVFNSSHIKPINPLLVGSCKQYLPIFEYSDVSHVTRKNRNINSKKILADGNTPVDQTNTT